MTTTTKTTPEGTCPACFRKMALDSAGHITRHGWSEVGKRRAGSYGNAWHNGACFGVGYPSYEESPRGTSEYLQQVVYPMTLRAQERVDFLATMPTLIGTFTARYEQWDEHGRHSWGEAPYSVRYTPGLTFEPFRFGQTGRYPRMDLSYGLHHMCLTMEALGVFGRAKEEGAMLVGKISGWLRAEHTLRAAKAGPVVHYKAVDKRKPICVRLRSTDGMQTTQVVEEVTCAKCRKALAIG